MYEEYDLPLKTKKEAYEKAGKTKKAQNLPETMVPVVLKEFKMLK